MEVNLRGMQSLPTSMDSHSINLSTSGRVRVLIKTDIIPVAAQVEIVQK